MNRTPHNYNATVQYKRADGTIYCTGLVQILKSPISGKLRIYRASGIWSHANGTEDFHDIWKTDRDRTLSIGGDGSTFDIMVDDGAEYKNRIMRL